VNVGSILIPKKLGKVSLELFGCGGTFFVHGLHPTSTDFTPLLYFIVSSRTPSAKPNRPDGKENKTVSVPEILRRLDEVYGDPPCPLNHRNPFELLTATILSAQCTDKMVNRITPALFARYPTPHDLANADLEELERLIYQTGFYKNKAKHLKGMAQRVVDVYGGEIPDSLEDLLTLPGVARKTAHVLLNVWYKRASGIVVDTHVARISRLLGWTRHTAPDRIAADLEAIIPREHWIRLSIQLIEHGRNICIARRPQCHACFLNDLCPSANLPSSAPSNPPKPPSQESENPHPQSE